MRRFLLLPIVFAMVSIVADAHAEVLNTVEDVLDFGTVGQQADGIINGGQACGPTSVYNSFVYLTNHFNLKGLLQPGDPSKTINQLGAYMGGTDPKTTGTPADGVTSAQLVSGKKDYIAAQGLQDRIHVESQSNAIAGNHVTIQFLYQQLKAGQDVEIKFNWSGRGAHFVTVYGIDFDTKTGKGTLNIIDPWTDGAGKASASVITANLSGNNTDGFTISYSGGGAGASDDPDNPGDAGSGTIFSVAAESPVPEPSTLALLSLGGLGVGLNVLRRRRLTMSA